MKLNIGANIRRLRREANLTQEELGRELDVSPQAISRWENGSAYPDIEFLPTLAKYFGMTVDRLMGYDADGDNACVMDLLREFVEEGRRETPDVERVIAIIREMRRDHLSHFDGGFWWAARDFYRLPGVLPELRKTAEAILTKSTDKLLREAVIYHMSVYEDDEHIGAFMDAHAAIFDLMYQSLYRRRYRLRDEKEQAEVFRQLYFREVIDDLLRYAFLRGDRELSAEEHLRVNTLQLGLLNRLCGAEAPAEHIISGDGVVGEWSAARVWLGILRAGHLASTGDTEGAFAALEDTLSLLEKIVQHVETVGAEVQIRCGWLDKAQYRVSLPDFYHDGRRRLGEGWEIGPCAIGAPTCDVHGMLTSDEESLRWLEPIRNDPRYRTYVERVEAILWNGESQDTSQCAVGGANA